MSSSYLERIAESLMKEANIPIPEKEFQFCKSRKWRADYVWIKEKVILEVEGGIWMKKGGHTSSTGVMRDIEKYNEATLLGYRVIRATKLHLINGQMIEWLKRALNVQ